MPERYSDEHLRLLQQGIPVYPGDEALIAQIAGQARTDSRRYPDIRGAIAGDPMAGNVTPRFGMDTARQRSTNLGLPKAKRKVVEKIVDDPNTPNTVTTTIEDEVPRSQHDIMMEQFQTHKDASTVPSFSPLIQSAQAAGPVASASPRRTTQPTVGNELRKEQDPSGLWWWVDSFGNFIARVFEGGLEGQGRAQSVTGQAQLAQAQSMTETTGERIQRLARESEARRVQQEQTDTGTGEKPPLPDTVVTATRPQPNFQQGDPVARIYGDWSRDIPTERKDYLRAMKDIYFKMSMLSAVASLTGGEDQSEGFGRMQVEMLNYMMETDNEDRLLKIHKGVYFNKDGKWDPPKNERMAHQRAVRFGAGPEEASEFSGHYPKEEGVWQNWKVKEKATEREITMASKGRPEGYDPDLFEFTIVPPSTSARGKFMEYKLQFDAAGNDDARLSVARRWAREILRQSGMPIVQPPTDKQVQEAHEELRMGEEYKAKNISGRQD